MMKLFTKALVASALVGSVAAQAEPAEAAAGSAPISPLADPEAFLGAITTACPFTALSCQLGAAFSQPNVNYKLKALVCLGSYPAELESAECLALQEPLATMLPPTVSRSTVPEVNASKVSEELKGVVAACPALVYNCEYAVALDSDDEHAVVDSTACMMSGMKVVEYLPTDCQTALTAAAPTVTEHIEEAHEHYEPELAPEAVETAVQECKDIASYCHLEKAFEADVSHYLLESVECMARYPAKFVSETCQTAMEPLVAVLPSPVERVEAPVVDKAAISADLLDIVDACGSLVYHCKVVEAFATKQPLLMKRAATCLLFADKEVLAEECATTVATTVEKAKESVKAAMAERMQQHEHEYDSYESYESHSEEHYSHEGVFEEPDSHEHESHEEAGSQEASGEHESHEDWSSQEVSHEETHDSHEDWSSQEGSYESHEDTYESHEETHESHESHESHEEVVEAVVEKVEAVKEAVVEAVQEAASEPEPTVEAVKEAVVEKVEALKEAVEAVAASVDEAKVEAVEDLVDAVKDAVEDASEPEDVVEAVEGVVDQLVESVEDAVEAVPEPAEAVEAVKEGVGGLFSSASNKLNKVKAAVEEAKEKASKKKKRKNKKKKGKKQE